MRLVLISRFLVVFTIAVLPNESISAKLDPTVGSNWYIPSSTVSSNVIRTDSQQYNYRTISGESHPSSFLPTTANAARPQLVPSNAATAGESAKFYYQTIGGDGTSGKQFNQYYHQYQTPDGNSYAAYPTSGSADQRQEFLDPNVNNGLGDFGDDSGDGGFLDNMPSIANKQGLGGIASGITGAANNIAQGIGLGGLGLAGGLIVLAIGGPMAAMAVLFPIGILIIAIMGFPVLQLTLPPSDPNLTRKLKVGIIESARKAKEVLQSEECVERLSCGLARKARKLPYESWILQKMDNTTNVWANRVSTSVKTGRAGDDCNRFKCTIAVKLKEVYDVFVRK